MGSACAVSPQDRTLNDLLKPIGEVRCVAGSVALRLCQLLVGVELLGWVAGVSRYGGRAPGFGFRTQYSFGWASGHTVG